ncbi:putative fucose kinase [Leishmania major strain Friedlin]|uniref:Putative fucose kinase n=1 Tax=Leishmania major TaxID=5664 RepID=Q4QEX2_LEIMA|nr:putative fucose kinase [Leishmania major strain Friedlin]CAG9572082.1 fucose_kinase_-_putative [Leishmania major strain Friedlin]CAJ03540.1 putative fucose kinase [Leishmania major strain Friedlin]|eukprot:XP_001682126.1 putative fucose kinase [Leishmania major strain Friedlin]
MNVSFLFSLPCNLAEFKGAAKLLADAAALPLRECGAKGGVAVPGLFCGCDPEGRPLGSGGGTVHLLHACYVDEQRHAPASAKRSFLSWLRLADNDGRVIVHAGGLSRRLPAYAAMGKALLPLPPRRWHRGSQLSRTLLSTQVPMYREIVAMAPARLRTLIACGDVCVDARGALPSLAHFADSDVLCFGINADASLFQNHGVLFTARERPLDLDYMLQKPSLDEVRRRVAEGRHSVLLDVGMWMLSDRAVEVLTRKCLGGALDAEDATDGGYDGHRCTAVRTAYDLYSEFASALGNNAPIADPEIAGLKASVVELRDAEFLHYGTNRQLISAVATLQGRESPTPPWSWGTPLDGVLAPERGGGGEELDFAAGDAMPLLATPSSVIVQNSVVLAPLDGSAAAAAADAPAGAPLSPVRHLWVESSWVGARWALRDQHILTGVPRNDWALALPPGACVSVVPVLPAALGGCGDGAVPHAARPYHMDDAFCGDVRSGSTMYMGVRLHDWLSSRGFSVAELYPAARAADGGAAQPLDMYEAALFPVCATEQQLGDFLYVATLPLEAATGGCAGVDAARLAAGQAVWRTQPRVSAMDLLRLTDVPAMLRNSEYYERRMLTLMLALVAGDPAAPRARSPVLPGPMVALLQQQFFLLDLNRVAQRVVELGVPLPRHSGPTEWWGGVDAAGNAVALSRQVAPAAPFAKGAAASAGSWAQVFSDEGSPSGGGRGAPLCTAPGRIVAAHYHAFASRLMELALEAMDAAEPPVSAAEKARRLALLRASSAEEARSLVALHDAAALAELRAAIMDSFPDERHDPEMSVHLDQIIWGRCPIRIDVAGAWTDTPPYAILSGGSVINVAVELNGQPPVQVYVRVREDPIIMMHSIDSGEQLSVSSFDEIRTYATMQNPFSIPKAALALCGFLPEFCATEYATLREQLAARFGGHGLEISLFVAIPTGSGLGTSSIVAGTVLRSLAEFCKLPWDNHDVCRRVLLIEQMLTAGGGWQDQYGGLFEGLKLVQCVPGLPCLPTVRWMPDSVYTDPRFAACHLLYYTGITRMAKGILGEIVRDVLLNNGATLQLLREMGGPTTAAMYDAITTGNYKGYARLVHRTWEQKKRLDDGVCNPTVQSIVDIVEPYVWGLTLPGAGGGGYMYMCAKDEACARRIRELLTANPPNGNARFVEMSVSASGLQISRS